MGKYQWDKDLIQSTLTNERKINSLTSELDNKTDEEVNNLFNRKDTFRNFKRYFRHDFVTLARLDEDMLEYLCFLYQKVNLKDLSEIVLPQHDMDDEELVSYVTEFFEDLGDKEITEEIKEIVNPDNHFLKIAKKNETELSTLLTGRVIKDENSKISYGSFYKKGTDEDTVILAHEIGHMLSHRLFHDKENEIVRVFLTEVESYYMELLAGYYLGEKYDMQKLALCFRANRLTKMMDNAWDMHIQYIMNSYLLNVNYKTLDKQLKEEGYIKDITEEDYQKFIKIPFLYRSKMINSYLVALELFRITLQDKEKGIATYKKLFTSDITNYQKLLNKFKLNYLKDSSTLDCMVEESKQLKKILSNM